VGGILAHAQEAGPLLRGIATDALVGVLGEDGVAVGPRVGFHGLPVPWDARVLAVGAQAVVGARGDLRTTFGHGEPPIRVTVFGRAERRQHPARRYFGHGRGPLPAG